MWDRPENEEILFQCETKKLKDIFLDSDDDEKYEKYVRLTDDNINGIEHKLPFTFKDYVLANQDTHNGAITDNMELEDELNGTVDKSAEGMWQDKNKLKFMKNREKLKLLRKLKTEAQRKKQEEKNNKLFEKPKWWMYLMKNAERFLVKTKMKKPPAPEKNEISKEWEIKRKPLPKERINVMDFLEERSKINEKKREEKALLCLDFWNRLEKERKDLMKMMLAVELKRYLIKAKKEKVKKLMEKTPKEPLSVTLINLTYLKLKKKQCIRMIKKHFHSIIGPTDEEVKQLKTKLNEVKQLFRKRNDWTEDHLISLMNLSKKVYNADKNKNSMKEEVINYYIDGIFCMMEVQKKVAKNLRESKITDQNLYNRIYFVMKDTEIFISEQVLIFRHLRNVLLHTEWTYLYYARMRVIRLLDEAVKKIICNGYKLNRKSTEMLKAIERNEIICDEPEYQNEYIKNNPVLERVIQKDFCPISDHSII